MKRSRRTDRVVLVLHRPFICFPTLALGFALAVLPPVPGAVQPDSPVGTQGECEPDRVSQRMQVRLGEQDVDMRFHSVLADEQAPRHLAGAQTLADEVEHLPLKHR